MSLIEILAAMVVLVVGIFAVIRILVPGLQSLPRSAAVSKATQSATLVARQAESATALRPDVILRGVPIDAALAASGWRVYHDVGMEDVDQISLARSTTTQLRTLYPNVVCGELFEAPAPFQAHLVEGGPYVPLTRRVYLPEPWTQVNAGAEDDADPAVNARTFSETGGTITLDSSGDLISTIGFIACYTYIDGTTGGYIDLVGEEPTYVPGSTTFTLTPPGAIVPLSVTLYEIPAGVIAANADSGRAGSILFDPLNGPTPGTKLACMYEMASHVRAGLDAMMTTRRPFEQDLVNNPVPDICSFDTYVPLADTTLQVDVGGAKQEWSGRIVRLPVDSLDLSSPLDEIDTAATEPIRIVSRFDGSITAPDTTTALPTGDVFGAFVRVNGIADGMPIRIYYRVPGNWSIERHMAAANYAVLALNTSSGAWEFVPGSSPGLKQEWFMRTEFTQGTDTMTRLTYHASPAGTAMDFWDGVTGGQMVFPEADGHRVAVDYRYDAGGGREQRVTGEMHLVDFSTHAIVLEHPSVLSIDAIRGASYKSRICFDDVNGKRVRVDVDTIVMR
jgi:hypothetical protein